MITIRKFLLKYHRPLFYSIWLLLQLIQAAATELFDDEAYYWVYSKFPSWGYFDHPPMIALMIKAGYAVFANEFGVRLIPALLTTASLYFTETLTERKNPWLFYALCASLAIAQIAGIMAVPDAPLMFFVALFFYLYRRFVAEMSATNTFLLGICMALMLYTKYHAALIILFTLFSNWRLLKKYQPYLAVAIAVICFLPHMYWQHLNGYPSLQFHLFERNSSAYQVNHTLEFIIGQILIAGPFVGWLLLFAAFAYKPSSPSERALKYSFTGIYIFFLLSTMKGKAEANWTIPAFISLIVLSHQYLNTHAKWKNILYKSVPVTLLAVFVGRAVMMADLPPNAWIFKDEFHGNKRTANAIHQKAQSAPVVFVDSYQRPSKYWFYSGDTALALNTPKYRRNNFNFWNIEDDFIGRPAYVVGDYDKKIFTETFPDERLEKKGGFYAGHYFSFSRVLFDNMRVKQSGENRVTIRFSTRTPEHYLSLFQRKPYDSAQVYVAVYKEKKLFRYLPANMRTKDIAISLQQNIISTNLELPAGRYTGKFAISSCIPGHPSLNSSKFNIVVR